MHGDKYDYSGIDYQGTHTPIELVCPEHGSFWVKPVSHLRKSHCKECMKIERDSRGRKRLDTDEFIRRAKDVHGSTYDYSCAIYTEMRDKIQVICKKHGSFWQAAFDHLLGRGCKKCRHEESRAHRAYTTDDFISEAKEKHGDFFDYIKTQYVERRRRVVITCPKHGDKLMFPHNHLRGFGCGDCATKRKSKPHKKTRDEFLQSAKEIHGHKYDYRKVRYKGTNTRIRIICPHHGEFLQMPYHHLRGNGCPKCGMENRNHPRGPGFYTMLNVQRGVLDEDKPAKLYLLTLSDGEESFIKIGITCIDKHNDRFCQFKPYKIEGDPYLFNMRLKDAIRIEQLLIKYRTEGEKYTPKHNFGGSTECFRVELKDEIMIDLCEIYKGLLSTKPQNLVSAWQSSSRLRGGV